MMPKNDEGVIRRLEMLRRRCVSLKSAVRQLVVEIEEEKRENCGDVKSVRKAELRVCWRRLFDANIRMRNLARNYKRKKNLERSISTDETSDLAGLAQMERCGDDFDPNTVVVGKHEPPRIPVLPLPHRFSLKKYSILSSIFHTASLCGQLSGRWDGRCLSSVAITSTDSLPMPTSNLRPGSVARQLARIFSFQNRLGKTSGNIWT